MLPEHFQAVLENAAAAFTAGCAACASGALRASNPHPANTPAWGGWQKGWMDEYRRLPELLRAARLRREPDIAEVGEQGV